jgi:uncharacterized protein (TIGR03000 family)
MLRVEGKEKNATYGCWRQFVTPLLPGNRQLVYNVKAMWTERGQTVTESRTIRVAPGARLTIDFLAPMEENASTLPVPLKMGQPQANPQHNRFKKPTRG